MSRTAAARVAASALAQSTASVSPTLAMACFGAARGALASPLALPAWAASEQTASPRAREREAKLRSAQCGASKHKASNNSPTEDSATPWRSGDAARASAAGSVRASAISQTTLKSDADGAFFEEANFRMAASEAWMARCAKCKSSSETSGADSLRSVAKSEADICSAAFLDSMSSRRVSNVVCFKSRDCCLSSADNSATESSRSITDTSKDSADDATSPRARSAAKRVDSFFRRSPRSAITSPSTSLESAFADGRATSLSPSRVANAPTAAMAHSLISWSMS
mmetsp:Transcript_10747/g.35745  ORF Transcript_10747/g.35745 Transcript_10747/m.35745 type:complete len:283 (+) Transcript_10747:359-1207(+)